MRLGDVLRLALWLGVAAMASAAVAVSIWPAVWLAPRLADATGGRLALLDVDGTIWRGSATLVVGRADAAAGPGVVPGRLSWRCAYRFPLGVDLELIDPAVAAQPMRVTIRDHVVHVAALDAELPIRLLAGLGTPFNTIGLAGQAQLHAAAWTVQQDGLAGQADVVLEDVGSQLSTVVPLGTYRLHAAAQGPGIVLQLATLRGPLYLDAHGSFDRRGVSLAGTAHAAPEAAERLADLLSVLGHPEGNVIAFNIGTPGP